MCSPSSTLRTRDACTCVRLGLCALHTTISPIIRHPSATPKEAGWTKPKPPNDVVHPKECDDDSMIINRGFPPPADIEGTRRSLVQVNDSNDVVDSSQTQMLSFQEGMEALPIFFMGQVLNIHSRLLSYPENACEE